MKKINIIHTVSISSLSMLFVACTASAPDDGLISPVLSAALPLSSEPTEPFQQQAFNDTNYIETSDQQLGFLAQVPRTQTASIRCLLYTSPSPRDLSTSRMPSSA